MKKLRSIKWPSKWVIYDQYHIFTKNWFVDIGDYDNFDQVLDRYRFFREMYPGQSLGLTTFDLFKKKIDSYK